jgi:hypothetical protein
MRRVKDTGGSLSIACPIEMVMRHGMPPFQQALDAGSAAASSSASTSHAYSVKPGPRAIISSGS